MLKEGGVYVSAYNLKVYKYNGYLQFRIYSKPIFISDNDTDKNEKEKEENFLREKGFLDDKEIGKKNYKSDEERLARVQKVSINRTIQSIYEYALNNDWDWFCTFTFSSDSIDRNDYKLVMSRIRKWCNHIKTRKCKDMKYLLVPEKHKKGGYHVHGLFSHCDGLTFVDSGRVAVGKKAYKRTLLNSNYPTIYNVADWKNGFSTATRIVSSAKCASYICKYITKDLCIELKNYRRFYPSSNLKRAEQCIYNMSYEDIEEWIKSYEVDYMKTQHIAEAGQTIKYITVLI